MGPMSAMEHYREVLATGEPYACEFRTGAGPVSNWLRLQVVKLRNGIAITASDITLRKQYEERLTCLAERDALTGLLNRSVLKKRLEQAIAQSANDESPASILLLDLDHFKEINDSFGHVIGDSVLRSVAQRLQNCVRAEDHVIRIGGDEFVVLMPGMRGLGSARALAERVLASVGSPIAVAGQQLQVSCSMGCAVLCNPQETVNQILARADTAMYAAKALGKNRLAWDGAGWPVPLDRDGAPGAPVDREEDGRASAMGEQLEGRRRSDGL